MNNCLALFDPIFIFISFPVTIIFMGQNSSVFVLFLSITNQFMIHETMENEKKTTYSHNFILLRFMFSTFRSKKFCKKQTCMKTFSKYAGKKKIIDLWNKNNFIIIFLCFFIQCFAIFDTPCDAYFLCDIFFLSL